MLDRVSMPVICAANPCSCQWFVHLKSLMNHPILKEDEKFLWCWLATLSANNHQLTCSFTYEQLSTALNKPAKVIHRILFRLKIMGLCAPQARSELQNSQWLSFIEDEGRSFETGFQEQVSNHLKQLLPKAAVVSIEEKPDLNLAGGDQKDE